MEANGSRDRSVESDSNIHVTRKRSLSDASIKADRERSETPFLFVEESQPVDRSRQDSAHAEQTADGPQFSEESQSNEDLQSNVAPQMSEELQSMEEPQSQEQPQSKKHNTTKYGSKRIATTSNAVSAQYSLNRVQLDANGCVPAYNVKNEQTPLLGAFHPSFKLAEQDATRACSRVIGTYKELVAMGYKNDEMAVVCGARGLAACKNPSDFYPKVASVAVLGPAGHGKSSAVNSILSQKKAAFEHDGDDRGTYVPHEYCAAQPDQTSLYRVVAIYYSKVEIKRTIEKCFGDIQSYILDDEEDDGDDSEEDVPQQKFDTALGFFTDLLCSQEQFCSLKETEKYFQKRIDKKHTKERICTDLNKFVEQFLKSRSAYREEKEIHDIQEETELHRIFKSISRPSKVQGKQQPSPWPILQKVVVHQSVPILNAGVVIADTPGFDDTNLAVVDNTTRYLKRAGTILVFLSYKRILNNSPIDRLLRECIALGKMHHTRLVVTMIDDMKPHSNDEKAELDIDEEARLDKAEATIRFIVDEIKAKEIAQQLAKAQSKFDEYVKLADELTELRNEESHAKAAKTQTSIEIRCRAIEKSLVSKLKEIEKSKNAPNLPITFISNSQYQGHVAGYKPPEVPCLNLEGTGVLSLRRELYSIPTYGKLHNLKGLATLRLPNVLMGVQGILTKTHMERKEEVRRTINLALQDYDQPAELLTDEVMKAFEKRISKVVKDNLPAWKDDAMKLLCNWGDEVPAGTFKAVCQRGGSWINHKKLGDIDWNAALIELYADELRQGFDMLSDDVEVLRKDFATDVKNSFDQLRIDVETSQHAQGKDMSLFYKFVGGMAREVVEKMNAEFDELNENVSQIGHIMTLDSTANYLIPAMKATWMEASTLSKDNSRPASAVAHPSGGRRKRNTKRVLMHGARERVIADKLRGEAGKLSIFKAVVDLGKTDIQDVLKLLADASEGIMKDGSDRIMEFFDSHFKDSNELKTDDPVATAKLQEAVEAAQEIVEVSMIQHIEECEAYEQSE